MNETIEVRRKKALFRAQRRGFRELDMVFHAFADAHLPKLDGAQLDSFEALLSVPDWEMYAWLVGHKAVPENYDTEVFALLRAFKPNFGA